MSRNNNFDFLRLIFACFVIISHSYPLSGIKDCGDWLCQITSEKLSLSYVGLTGFFIISGFLIFKSLERSENIVRYYFKRLLRLIPGLFGVLLITVLLAPFVYENTTTSYFQNRAVWTYIPNNLFLFTTQFTIDGVFESNPYKSKINGSLWTLPYEFSMYIALSLLFIFRTNKVLTKILIFFALALLIVANNFYFEQLNKYVFILSFGALLDFAAFFTAGSLLAAINIEKFKHINVLLICSLFFLLISFPIGYFDIIKVIFLPLMIILFGLKSTPGINSIGRKVGDLSYGIYIYGFAIQQTLVYYFKFNYLHLMVTSLVVSFFFAYISWHLIEKRALKLKNLRRSPNRSLLSFTK